MAQLSIQEQIPGNRCYACGPTSKNGLQIRSYWDGSQGLCDWQPPGSHYTAGPPQILNGGIVATVIDCHAVCTAIADAYQSEGRPIGTGQLIWYVTGSLKVTYLRPTPNNQLLSLSARVKEKTGRKAVVACSLSAGGLECATAEVIAVRVQDTWAKNH